MKCIIFLRTGENSYIEIFENYNQEYSRMLVRMSSPESLNEFTCSRDDFRGLRNVFKALEVILK